MVAKTFAQHMDEATIGRVLDYLAATDESCAQLKAEVGKSEHLAKVAEAMAYRSITNGPVEDRKQEARIMPQCIKAWETHFTTVVAYEKVRARREHAMLLTDMWRSYNANKRAGSV